MAVKTPFSTEELRDILSQYDLGVHLSHKEFEKGSDQTNILLETVKGKFAFRYYEKRSEDYVLFEIDLLNHLAKDSYICPAPIANKQGKFTGSYHSKSFALFSFLEGEHNDNDGNCLEVAKVIGKLHTITRGYKPPYFNIREGYDPSSIWQNAKANAAKMSDHNEAGERLNWLRTELDRLELPVSMPKGAVHGDTNPSNFLYIGGKVSAVLDFDQASYAYLLYDVANLIYWWTWPDTGDIDFDKTKTLMANYEDARQLTEEEKRHLIDMLKLCICVGIGWFIHEHNFPNSQRKVEQLNSIGRENLYAKLCV